MRVRRITCTCTYVRIWNQPCPWQSMIRIVLRSRIVRIPFSRFVAVNMASSSGDSVDDSNPSVSPQAGGGKKAPQAGTGWMSSLRRFFSHPSEARGAWSGNLLNLHPLSLPRVVIFESHTVWRGRYTFILSSQWAKHARSQQSIVEIQYKQSRASLQCS